MHAAWHQASYPKLTLHLLAQTRSLLFPKTSTVRAERLMLTIKTSQKPVGDVTVETSIFYIQSVVFLQKRLKTNTVCSFSTLAQTFCNCCCLSSTTHNFYIYLIFFLFSSLHLKWKIITGRSQQEEKRSFRRFIQRPFLYPVSPVRTGSYYLCWPYLSLTEAASFTQAAPRLIVTPAEFSFYFETILQSTVSNFHLVQLFSDKSASCMQTTRQQQPASDRSNHKEVFGEKATDSHPVTAGNLQQPDANWSLDASDGLTVWFRWNTTRGHSGVWTLCQTDLRSDFNGWTVFVSGDLYSPMNIHDWARY